MRELSKLTGGAFCASSGKTPDHGTCLACGMPGQVSCSFDEDRRLYDSGEEANETQRYCWDGRSPSKEVRRLQCKLQGTAAAAFATS